MPLLPLEKQEAYRRLYRKVKPGWQPATEVYEREVRGCLSPQSLVLDVGCGRGGVLERLHGEAALAVGVDPDVFSLMEHRAPAVKRVAALAEALPFADGTFHLVIASWVLEHLAHPAAAFAEIARVLRRGGRFVFLTPNVCHPVAMVNWLMSGSLQALLVPRLYGRAVEDTFVAHYRANSPDAIERLARASGLRRVSLHLIEDPTYLAFGGIAFRLSILAERMLPRRCKIHLVGIYEKG